MTRRRRRAAWSAGLGAALLVLALYVVAPGLTLLRIARAAHGGDRATLVRLVDFRAVRAGLAREVAASLLGAPPDHGPHGLPPFGFSFVAELAQRNIARELTPGTMIRLARLGTRSPAGAAPRLAGVWMDGPRRLVVALRLRGQRRPIRLRLRLGRSGWRLEHLWLPRSLLREAQAQARPPGAPP